MTEPVIKSCVTCAYCIDRHDPMFAHCSRFPKEFVNYVSGRTWREYPLCFFVREEGKQCGPEGSLWEPLEETPKDPGGRPLRRLLGAFSRFLPFHSR